MSKFMRTMLCVLLILCILSGCKSEIPLEDYLASQKGNESSATIPAKVENTPEQNKLLSVLYNEVPFVDETGKTVYVKDYNIAGVAQQNYAVPESYAFIDFDNDGSIEMLANVSTDYGFFLVLHMDDEQVYGYKFTLRSMRNPKTDGTFEGSGGAAESAIFTLKFSGNQYEMTELAYHNDLPEIKEYRINGVSATQEDYQTFYNDYVNKPDVQWKTVEAASWQESADNVTEKYSVVYKAGENFVIYTNQEALSYYYIIKDKNGAVIDRGCHDSRGSFDLAHHNGLLILDYGYGGSSFDKRYYDISGSRVSQFFPSPVAESNRLVAYFVWEDNQIKLIVRDIFDATVFSKAITRDFSDFVFKQNYAGDFIENNTKLRLTYPINNSAEPVTEEIPLI